MTSPDPIGRRSRPAGAGTALAVLALATALAMGVWFSAAAVVPQLTAAWSLSPAGAALLTVAVQLGFVVGALVSAGTGLADAVPARRLLAAGAAGAAVANAGLLLADGPVLAVVSRLLTGAALALVYPSALKEVSTWFRRGRGTALGAMVGALTLGTALPHVVAAAGAGASAGGAPWRVVVTATSVCALLGALLALLLRRSGPHGRAPAAFDRRAALAALRRRPVVLAVLGYVGHMWELYAMWAWTGALLAGLGAVAALPDPAAAASALTALCVGVGALGCLAAGVLGDRVGRPLAVLVCVVGSSTAALALAVLRGGPLPLVVALVALWGFWVVADSAQLSALVAEHADPDLVGGAVAVQMAAGYLTTAVTVWLVPVVVEAASWSAALVLLAAGSLAGGVAVLALWRDERAAAAPGRATADRRRARPGP
ncbi:MFS transporter [uncultured Pseudokineococcus sp.]|uniref:MFS transporter n=1 Tax=uncultured Pseudokineococcus sp. TaxID=1642928 RepID=UPI00260F3AAC|nr:MFS transporter [uncultured Pseudokineococcus sp.]